MNLTGHMNQTKFCPSDYLSSADAAQAIRILRILEERLGQNAGYLGICVAFTKDALWAAAYPDDPHTMLDMVANQAENALG